ncbi:MAG: hypothetical protein ACAH65_02935 [Chloroflexota bacterium]
MRSKRLGRTAPILISISLLLVGASWAEAASPRIAVSTNLQPDCSSIRVDGTWAASPEQVYISFRLTDLITGQITEANGNLLDDQVQAYEYHDLTGAYSTPGTTHRFLATVSIQDNTDTTILRGSKRVRFECAM